MPLTEAQKQQLNKCSISQIIDYIDRGHVVYPDDLTYLTTEKRVAVDAQMATKPNPNEQKEWNSIVPYLSSLDEALCAKLQSYISHWGTRLPIGNHVDEARSICAQIEDAIYNQVDKFSLNSLISYLESHPNTIHINEIDDTVWQLICVPPFSIDNISNYISHFPSGLHRNEAAKLQQDYFDWENVRYSNDIFAVHNYIMEHPQSLLINDAKVLELQLKNGELVKMRTQSEQYSVDRLFALIERGIFNENELISKKILTPKAIKILRNVATYKKAMPDLESVMKRVRKECLPNHTDIYLFGIPSTGKSCVLMGLIGADQRLTINTKVAGGEYAAALQQYLDAGFTPGATRGTFVTTIKGTIPDGNIDHDINLVEMSGEEFAYKLAQNEEAEVSLADMGEGAPELLANDNRKVFFIIVDPTVEYVPFKRIVTSHESYIDADGVEQQIEREDTIDCFVNQKTVLKGMVDLFTLPQNSKIMEKVDGIHIIVTKADTLDTDLSEREQKAIDRFNQYHKNIIEPLVRVCKEYDINRGTNGRPKLYTFSLGTFYPGGIYEYNDSDSNKLIDVIRANTDGIGNMTFLDRVKKIFN